MSEYVDTIGRWGEGNIDLNNRAVVYNADGSFSTECSLEINVDGKEVLIPTVINGIIQDEEYAIDYFFERGEYLGMFNTVAACEDYAQRLHERQEWYYGERMRHMRRYNYAMGFKANSVNLPDPTKFTYQVGDLDTSGSRDATGLLHRAYVATKINFELSWNSLDWEMLQTILAAVNYPQFTFTAIDPRTFNSQYTGQYYVGDRTGDAQYYLPDKDDVAQFSLKLKFIEY